MTHSRPHRLLRLAALSLALVTAAAITATAAAGVAGPKSTAQDGRLAIVAFPAGQIYTVNPDGTRLRQVTHLAGGAIAVHPDWSPGGTHIAFTRIRTANNARIYTMAADGTHQRPVFTDQPGYRSYTPRYTPDGRSIIFARCKPNDGVCAIFSVRLDGTHLTALTHFKEGLNEAVDFAPAVSRDGRHVAFGRFLAGGIRAQVWIMDADGSHQRPLTSPALQAYGPNWSPDSRRITFSSNCCRLGGNVYTMSPDGTNVRALTHTAYPLFSGGSAYSPTGAHIAFVTNRRYPDRCCSDLFTMSANGLHQRIVHTGLVEVDAVAWGTAPLS